MHLCTNEVTKEMEMCLACDALLNNPYICHLPDQGFCHLRPGEIFTLSYQFTGHGVKKLRQFTETSWRSFLNATNSVPQSHTFLKILFNKSVDILHFINCSVTITYVMLHV
jgi:hypothetical protein